MEAKQLKTEIENDQYCGTHPMNFIKIKIKKKKIKLVQT
jgi:hypothetical protein